MGKLATRAAAGSVSVFAAPDRKEHALRREHALQDLNRRFDFFEFVILNAPVWLRHDGDDDLAIGRMYIMELRREAGSEHWSNSYGVYHDRYARIDGRWWFARRRYHSLGRTPPEGGAFPFPTGDLF